LSILLTNLIEIKPIEGISLLASWLLWKDISLLLLKVP